MTPTPRLTPTPILTPVVEAVVRNPGPAAAAGALWEIALAFDEEMAFAEIETLTGPPYLGRLAGSAQGRAAGDYIAARFAAYGLRPAGEDGGFFQLFTLTLNTLSAEPTLRVTAPNGESRDYDFRSDFSPVIHHFTGGGEAEGEVVWVQYCAHDDFDAVDLSGYNAELLDGFVEQRYGWKLSLCVACNSAAVAELPTMQRMVDRWREMMVTITLNRESQRRELTWEDVFAMTPGGEDMRAVEARAIAGRTGMPGQQPRDEEE